MSDKKIFLSKEDYKNIGLSLLKKDFLRFSKLHSWYKHIDFDGEIFYYYLAKGEQIRNCVEKNVEDSKELHWHFSKFKPKNLNYGEVCFGPFLRGELHGFQIIKRDVGKDKFENWIKLNYSEYYDLNKKSLIYLDDKKQQKIVNKEFKKYWKNLKKSYLSTFF